jgi:hypothetical protein
VTIASDEQATLFKPAHGAAVAMIGKDGEPLRLRAGPSAIIFGNCRNPDTRLTSQCLRE